MDERLRAIFDQVPAEEMALVAASALGVGEARPLTVEFAEITTPHADDRTIGIVRVSGTAESGGGVRPWSCVTKLIDLAVERKLNTPVDPANEVTVYQRGYFSTPGQGIRPARCHHISRPRDGLIVLWLEDLTGAKGPPFTPAELAQMAAHLGEWNASTAKNPPSLEGPLRRDFQIASWRGFDFPGRVSGLADLKDDRMVRQMFGRTPVEVGIEFVGRFGEFVERSVGLPHALALADCPVSNFFYRPGETIAIDWAGLGSEPVGADGGRFIGSALTWGRDLGRIVPKERELFEAYLAGMRRGGAIERRDIVRSGYLSELGFYLCTIVALPTMVSGPRAALSTAFFEKRFQTPLAEVGTVVASVIVALPSYLEEMRRLAR